MASLEEIRIMRLAKIELLKKGGMDPYPSKVPRDFCLADAKANFNEYTTAGAKEGVEQKGGKYAGTSVSLAGRIMAIRGQGAILFVVLDDGKGKFQAVFKKDEIPAELFALFTDTVDIGDFISVTGTFFRTERGEESILVKEWTMAAKSLLPLPEKWHGLTDVDERFRKRYLDFIMNPDLREIFKKKAQFWDITREFMKKQGFLEVETPTLEVTTGGAEATPFKTHHNDYDLPVFLRISVGELWQKRLMAAGFQKTFEIGRVYRNEGSSPEHAQEFTNMEFYWAYADYKDGMKLVTKLYRTLAEKVFGTTKFTTHGHTFDLADDWKKIDYVEEIKNQTQIDVTKASEVEMKAKLDELGVRYEGENRERLTDTLWKYCRKSIAGPAFLINHPALVAPLAKLVADKKNKKGKSSQNSKPTDPSRAVVQMFQPIIAGSEVGRGYSELNDPVDQAARFALQKNLIKAGDAEAMMSDREFVEMLEHAMPPATGFGFGERLFAFFTDKTLREVQMFPLMRPK
jgi:lysyl-tRNA synthetase class 2